MERAQSLDENVGNAPRLRRNKLLLVVSVIHGLGLLLCLIYICLQLSASKVPPKYPPIHSIRVQFTKCERENVCILVPSTNYGNMTVQDNGIDIKCDGFYLISLKGHFLQEVSLGLSYRKSRDVLLPRTKVSSIDAVTVAHLAFTDKVYLNVTAENNSGDDIKVNGGELILVHQNPGEFCGKKGSEGHT
ncbi:tumor necrosis factor ligand superfamily member 4 [Echinops telfairi]|uniref:Tumor necrosis factor ligand superfamily member 4 n=1 Tax=Echinops telfairi TaxID=9371 RepID=A0ABM0ISQ4_ECHTE|nr:tumor necrosis factor ligand superfamily member 4 [Echinops telfairi]